MLLAFRSTATDTLPGRVVGIVDGDPLNVLIEQQKIKVWLAGVDATEGAGIR